MSDLRVGVRLGVGLGLLLALLVGCAAVGLSGMSTLRSSSDELARAQQLTRRVMQVKFRSADFNGWPTAYAFDVLRGVPGAVDAQADALVAAVDEEAQAARRRAEADGRRARTLLFAVTGAALVAGALLVWSLTRSLTVPLRRLPHRLTEITDGDGDLTQRVDADRKDELGQSGLETLVKAFRY